MKTVHAIAATASLGFMALATWPIGYSSARAATTVNAVARAGKYQLTLMIGPVEHMYTLAEYKRLHPRSGEVMLRGSMAMPSGSSMTMNAGMSGPNHHLEVHVLDVRTHHVVSTATVSISYQTSDGMGMMGTAAQTVPIAVMEGIGLNTLEAQDVHFGNNVAMSPGNYTVRVTVNGVSAVFHVHLVS